MKIYLAGPDVFCPDAVSRADAARALLAAAGHRALIPLDNAETTAAGIYRANLALIAEADAVLANLEPFRGCEPDSGTCFEVGYAVALGKPVVAYLRDDRPLSARVAAHYGGLQRRPDGRLSDPQGLAVEDFDLPVNLMLGISCRLVIGGLADALAALPEG